MKEILGEKCYTSDEVAQILGMAVRTAREKCRLGVIRSFRIGRAMYVKESALREYTDGNREPFCKHYTRKKQPGAADNDVKTEDKR